MTRFLPILLFAFAGFLYWFIGQQKAQDAPRTAQVQGVIVAVPSVVDTNQSAPLTYFSPRVRYVVNGATHEFTDAARSTNPIWKAGEAIIVYFEPANPKNASIDEPKMKYMVLNGIMILAALAGVVLMFKN